MVIMNTKNIYKNGKKEKRFNRSEYQDIYKNGKKKKRFNPSEHQNIYKNGKKGKKIQPIESFLRCNKDLVGYSSFLYSWRDVLRS